MRALSCSEGYWLEPRLPMFMGNRSLERVLFKKALPMVSDRDYLCRVAATEIEKNTTLAPNNPGWE